jgi:hypothetical protein
MFLRHGRDAVPKKSARPREFWAAIYVKNLMERATHILGLIDAKWPANETPEAVETLAKLRGV